LGLAMTPWHGIPLAPRERYHRRLITGGMVGAILVGVSLAVGIAGYMLTEHLALIDAFLNAAMILSGMGPLHNPQSTAGKLFAGCYAIYCGIAVLGIAAVVLAPVIHRIFHRFHIGDAEAHERGKR
jgi:hypothetical protein